MTKRGYEIDGNRFSTLDEFFLEISRVLIPGIEWGHNLDAFNDILRGGFGTPDEGFVLRWKNSKISMESLAERRDDGETVYETLVQIIKAHGPKGAEPNDAVDLILD